MQINPCSEPGSPAPPRTYDWLADTLDSDLIFTTDEDTGWGFDSSTFHYGGDSAVSYFDLDDDEESCMQSVVYVYNQETIKFWWKVSSELNGDYLKFYIDETLKDSISGDVDWQQKSYDVSGAGSHTLKWVYDKDGSEDDGDDCGWVDCVQWTGSPPIKYPDPADWDTITYGYDPGGRRIEKTIDDKYTTKYCYDGGNVIAEYDHDNFLLRKYIYGPGVDEPVCMIDAVDNDAEYYYHYDGLGSVVALSDSEGDTVQTYEYSIYGQVAASEPEFLTNPYMFTGRRFDIETGLYYYRARYYNPHIGRFMQTDPIGYGNGINWYAYCGNNAVGRTDPSGLVASSTLLLMNLMNELYDIFGTDDLWFIYDVCDIWVTSDYYDVYDFSDDALLLSESEDDVDLDLTLAKGPEYVPGIDDPLGRKKFWDWFEKYKKDVLGRPPSYHPKGEELKKYVDDYNKEGRPKGSKPRGFKHRLQDMGDQVYTTVVTALAETLEMLPSDESLYYWGNVSSAVSIGASTAIIFGPSVLPYLATASGTLQPALSQ